jgi:putative acetyltransferase
MLATDAPQLADLFRASVDQLAEEDYSDDQREAWAATADDAAAFGKRLTSALTLVAMIGGEPAGFASLASAKLDMLYVAPDFARRGVATALVEAMERLAGARKIDKLTVDASDTARDFFAARGYVPQSRNTVPLADEWLGNTTMTRVLGAGSAAP